MIIPLFVLADVVGKVRVQRDDSSYEVPAPWGGGGGGGGLNLYGTCAVGKALKDGPPLPAFSCIQGAYRTKTAQEPQDDGRCQQLRHSTPQHHRRRRRHKPRKLKSALNRARQSMTTESRRRGGCTRSRVANVVTAGLFLAAPAVPGSILTCRKYPSSASPVRPERSRRTGAEPGRTPTVPVSNVSIVRVQLGSA